MLAIETSQRAGSVALRGRDGRTFEENLARDRGVDATLMPVIDRLLHQAGLQPNDLQALAVSIGPGGFTGLRVAISTAKLLGDALDLPIAAVPSALVAASSPSPSRFPVIVALAAKADRCWCTKVDRAGECEYRIVDAPGLRIAEEIDFTGITALVGDELLPADVRARAESEGVSIVPPAFSAAACLHLGEAMLRRGETTSLLELLPIYSREPEAVTLRRWRLASVSPGRSPAFGN